MHRRQLIQAAMAMLPWAPQARATGVMASTSGPTLQRVRPSHPDWPSARDWQRLNDQLGGSLIRAEPLLAPCGDPSSTACRDVMNGLRNPYYLGDQAAGTQVSGWLDAWSPSPSAYAIKARHAGDVVAGVNFARTRHLRLVVKGAGHSYQGTSNAPDSLLIWTRAMNQVVLHESFVPKGGEGRTPPQPAVTAEAGALWIDLYHRVTTIAGRYVQGGGCADVGVGGLIQSGGFGSFSKGFGTAAASLLEAEIVTADGELRTVNAYSHPDLFWALKGGGGGAWGVLTKVTLRTHELPDWFGAAWGAVRAHSDEAFERLVTRFMAFYASSLFNPHWGEQVALEPDRVLRISMVCQGIDRETARSIWDDFFSWVRSLPQDFTVIEQLGTWASSARDWWRIEGNPSMVRDPRPDSPAHHGWWKGDQAQVGAWLHGFDSVWLPAALLDRTRLPWLVRALIEGARHKRVDLHFNKGLAGAPPEAIAAAARTATNPAVLTAFALAIVADGEGPAFPGLAQTPPDPGQARKSARAVDLAMKHLRAVAPGAGSYVSESNFFNERWKEDFWGAHVQRLEAIKATYDADGLFFAHHGIGSDQWSPDGFRRVENFGGRHPGADEWPPTWQIALRPARSREFTANESGGISAPRSTGVAS